MLELAILGVLTEQELHGYELKKRLQDTLGFASGVSFGSLYPALARLETTGAVTAVEGRPATPVPATGSLGGELAAYRARAAATRGTRGKKVYAITPVGRQLFAELLAADAASSDDERLFHLRLVFARHLAAEARLGMLERRRLHLLDRLSRIRARVRARRDELDAYGRSLVEHDQEKTEHDLTWIEQLIARERAGTADPPTPAATAATPALAAGTPPAAPAAPAAPGAPAPTPAPGPAPAPAATRADRPSLSGLRPPPRPTTQEDT